MRLPGPALAAGRLPGCGRAAARRARWPPAAWVAALLAAFVLLCSLPGSLEDFAYTNLAASDVLFAGAAGPYLAVVDECGVCAGNSSSCAGCDGIPNSGLKLDQCGACLLPCSWDPAQCTYDAVGGWACAGNTCGFDRACADCTGVPNGPHRLDICGACLLPGDPEFAVEGGPPVSCIGCDGIARSGRVNDACGVCGGPGCGDLEPNKRSACCDCASTPNGPAEFDLCCVCLPNPDQYYQGLRGVNATKPAAQVHAAANWDQAAALYANASARAETAALRLKAAGTGGPFQSVEGTLATFRAAKSLLDAAWRLVASPAANDNSTCWASVYLLQNATNPRDACGVCGGSNGTCLACSPAASTAPRLPITAPGAPLIDDCGVCGGNNAAVDACGICFGTNATCSGCDGVANSGRVYDACLSSQDPRRVKFNGTIGEVGSGCSKPDAFRAACNQGEGGCCGCDGVPNSGKVRDACGVCLHPVIDRAAFNGTCRGCDGVPNSGAVFDACCECGGRQSYNSTCFWSILTPNAQQSALISSNYTLVGLDGSMPLNLTNSTGAAVPQPNAADRRAISLVDFLAGPVLARFFSTASGRPISNLTAYLGAAGLQLYDACGECAEWGYGGSTCAGCDGVAFSGRLVDPCGVCGGTCGCVSSCNGTSSCVFEQTRGPGVGSRFNYPTPLITVTEPTCFFIDVNTAAQSKTLCPRADLAAPFYQPFDQPGVPLWTGRPGLNDPLRTDLSDVTPWVAPWPQEAGGTCVLVVPPVGPPPPRARLEWLVFEFGVEIGPLSIDQLGTGHFPYTDPISGTTRILQLLPTSLIGRINTTLALEEVHYGSTSTVPAMAAAWSLRVAQLPFVVKTIATSGVPNLVTIVQNVTSLWGGAYLPLSGYPGLEDIVYPACSGVTFRGQGTRRHGRRTNANTLGIILNANLTSFQAGNLSSAVDAVDQPWNPHAEWIDEVVHGGFDVASCTCSVNWIYSPEPVPPTCDRVWYPWEEWRYYTAADSRLTTEERDGESEPTWHVSGGWWAQDWGGGAPGLFGGFTNAQLKQFYTPAVEQTRGPWRTDAHGRLTIATLSSPPTPVQCFAAGRLTPATAALAGAMWAPARQLVTRSWDLRVTFSLDDIAQSCTDVLTVSRSYATEVRTGLHAACAGAAGEGLAVVLYDGTAAAPNNRTVGEAGAGLGYSGLAHALAIELDLFFNAALDEPTEPHVAVLAASGGATLTASHAHRLGVSAPGRVPPVLDGRIHLLRVLHRANLTAMALVAALREGAATGAGPALAQALGGDAVGVLSVYLDDLATPLLTVPVSVGSVLRNATEGLAWVGVTAGNGAGWHAADVRAWNFTAL